MIECPKCQAKNHDASHFCSNCAAPLSPGAGEDPEAASLTKTLEAPVRVLKPNALIAVNVPMIEIGMATAAMRVTRRFRMNRKTTTAARNPPQSRWVWISSNDLRMNRD